MSSDFSTTLNDTGIPFLHPGEILSAAIVPPILGIICVSLRFWTRRSGQPGIGLDDWTILAALPCIMGMAAMMIYGVVKHAVGYPSGPYPVPEPTLADEVLFETTPEQTIVFIVYWVTWLLLILANGLIKLSALFFYRRVFVTNKWSAIDLITKFMIIVSLLWSIGFFFAQLFGCGTAFYKPFSSLAEVASCKTNARLNGLVISDLITDILVWIVPLPVVWKLHMSTRKKLGVTVVLSLASISLVAAIIRLKVELGIASGGYSIHVDGDRKIPFPATTLSLWGWKLTATAEALTVNIYWSNIESDLALIAACLPTLKFNIVRERASSMAHSLHSLLHPRRSDHSSVHQSNGGRSVLSNDVSQICEDRVADQHNYARHELDRVTKSSGEECLVEHDV